MDDYLDMYWQKRLEQCRAALEKNNFDAFICEDTTAAKDLLLKRVLSELTFESASRGDSLSMRATGILEEIESRRNIHLIKTFEENIPREEKP